jgi:flagellar protein FlaJ
MKYAIWVGKQLKNSGLKIEAESFLKLTLGLPLVFIFLSGVAYLIFGAVGCLAVLVLLGVAELTIHVVVMSIAKNRAKIAEELLPDALRLISSNLRAGVIPERAFIESARPEFGPLSIQIKEAGKALMLGSPIRVAFMKISENIDSETLRKTVGLITEGITRGGNLSSLLDGLADDLKSTMMLKKDIKAQVASYSMFIFLAIGFGAPILFSASLFLVETLIGLGAILPTETLNTGFVSLSLTGVDISKEFLLYYQIGLLIVSSIFGSLLIGLISDGREFSGIKFIPILLFINMSLFYFVKFIVLSSFAVF